MPYHCFYCKENLRPIQEIRNWCKCKRRFCDTHRSPSKHYCPYDSKAQHQKQLKKTLPAVIPQKLTRI
jgi:hypothetical protein